MEQYTFTVEKYLHITKFVHELKAGYITFACKNRNYVF